MKLRPRICAIEKIENFIKENHLSANSRIPSEREFCEMWSLNRTTLRFAIDQLIERGKLYRKRGSGTYVAVPKLVRNMLGVNSFSTTMRQDGYNLTTRMLSLRMVEADKQISKKLRIPLGSKVYESIRLRCIDGLPCVIETTYINSELFPGFDKHNLEKGSMYSIFKNIYKKESIGGKEMISVTYTTREEAEILGIDNGSPVFFTVGVTESAAGEPLEYYKALFRADKFKFTSTIKRINKENDC